MAKHLGYVPDGKFPSARRLCTQTELCSRVENRLSPLCLQVVDDVLIASIKAAYAGAIDLDDQIYMPALFGGSYKRYPLVYVDERQDLSPTMVALLEKYAKDRLVEVGDRWQSIYAFRGAQTDGMNFSKAKFNMHEMALSYSFRCPEAIVKAVHWHVPHMRWIKPGGTYEELLTLDPADIPKEQQSYVEITLRSLGRPLPCCQNDDPCKLQEAILVLKSFDFSERLVVRETPQKTSCSKSTAGSTTSSKRLIPQRRY